MSDNLRVISFEDKDAYPAITMQISEKGPRIALGLKDSETPGKPPSYHFDKKTLTGSKIAAALEGAAATLNDRESFNENHIARKLDNIVESLIERGHQFSEADRAVIKAVQNHAEQMAKLLPTPSLLAPDGPSKKLEAIEKISRKIGNHPSPDYPGLNNEELFPKQAQKFYDGLSPEQKAIFTNPQPPGDPFPSHDQYGEPVMWGIAPDRVRELSEHHRNETKQWEADIERFEKSLTTEQKAEWNKIKEIAEKRNLDFEKPDDGITKAPNAPIKSFAHEMQGPGRYAFNTDILKAQQLMNRLKTHTNSKEIDLGKSGPKANGEDGYFGPATRKSVMAAEELLGIVPPTGKITPEFLEKLEEKVDTLKADQISRELSQFDYKNIIEEFSTPATIIPLQQDSKDSFNDMLKNVFGDSLRIAPQETAPTIAGTSFAPKL